MNTRAIITSGLAAMIGLGAGCESTSSRSSERTYSTNVASNLEETSFSDRDVNYEFSVVRMSTGDYTFGKFPEGAVVVDLHGNPIPSGSLFPFWAVRNNEMVEDIYVRDANRTRIGSATGLVRVFVHDLDHEAVETNRGFTSQEIPSGKFISKVSEPKFVIPGIDFKTEWYNNIPFVETCSNGVPTQTLIMPSIYRLNHLKGLVEIHGDLFDENFARITFPIKSEKDSLADYYIKAEKVDMPVDSEN